jgi:ribokinase
MTYGNHRRSSFIRAKPIADAIRYASAAAISVTRLGAPPSIPDRMEVEAFLAKNQVL